MSKMKKRQGKVSHHDHGPTTADRSSKAERSHNPAILSISHLISIFQTATFKIPSPQPPVDKEDGMINLQTLTATLEGLLTWLYGALLKDLHKIFCRA
jgi:hypothetical protein